MVIVVESSSLCWALAVGRRKYSTFFIGKTKCKIKLKTAASLGKASYNKPTKKPPLLYNQIRAKPGVKPQMWRPRVWYCAIWYTRLQLDNIPCICGITLILYYSLRYACEQHRVGTERDDQQNNLDGIMFITIVYYLNYWLFGCYEYPQFC
jgi:hypothetical protein